MNKIYAILAFMLGILFAPDKLFASASYDLLPKGSYNKTSKRKKTPPEDYPLNLVARDARTGMLLNATFSVKAKVSGNLLKINSEDGQNLVTLKTETVYIITAKSEGYQSVEKEASFVKDPERFEAQNYNIDMKPQFGGIALIQIVDKNSSERLDVEFQVVGRTSGKKYTGRVSMTEPEPRVTLYGNEPFDLIVNTDLYKPFKQELPVELSESLKSISFKAELEKSEPALNIKIVDAESRQVIKSANVEVMNMTDAKVVLSSKNITNGELYTTVTPEKQYNVTVEAEGYEPALRSIENITFKKNITISLRKKIETVQVKEDVKAVKNNYLIRVIDADNKAGISQANIRLTDANNQAVNARKSDMEWFAELEDGAKYTIAVQAAGYQSYQKPLTLTLSRMIEVAISPAIIQTQTMSITTLDAATRKSVVANLKVTGISTNISANTDGQNAYKLTLPQQQNYQVEISATGYKPIKSTIDIQKALNAEQSNLVFELRKEIVTANYKISVVDTEKSPISQAEVRLTDGTNQAIKAIRNENTWTADLNEDDRYTIEVVASGYESAKMALQKNANKTAEVSLKKVVVVIPTQDIFVSVVDATTQKPLGASIKLTDAQVLNISGNNLDNNRYKFTVKQQQSYLLDISLAGYKPYKENITNVSVEPVIKTIRLKKDINTYTFSLRAVDAQSRQAIQAAKINAFNTATKQQISLKNTANEMTVELNSDANYTIEVEAPNYVSRSTEIALLDLTTIPNLKQDIFLSKKAPERHRIVITDADKQTIITEADLVLSNATNQNIAIVKNNGEWFAELGSEDRYTLEVKATDYDSKRVAVQANTDKLISLSIKKTPPPAMQELNFVAVDAVTRKPIEASFRFSDAQFNNINGNTNLENSKYKASLKPLMTYQLEVSAGGYKTYKGSIVTTQKAEELKEIQLKKEVYTFTLTASDIQTDERLKAAKFLVNDLTKKQPASARINPTTGEYLVDLNPDNDYSVEVSAEGYIKITDRINPMQLLIRNELKRNFALGNKAERYKIVLIDSEKKSRIPQAQVKLLDSDGQEVALGQNSQASEWNADLIVSENYTLEVKAAGFEIYKAKLEKDADKLIEVNIKRIATQDLFLATVDTFSKKAIAAIYKITAIDETLNGTTIATDNARFKASLRKQIAYKIEVLAQGYRPHHEDITISEDLTDANKVIQLRKEVYTFHYKAVDAQSKQVIASSRLQFYNLTGKKPVPAKNLNNGEYEVEFNPDSDYFVDIEATGYEKVFAKVDVDQLAGRQDFNQSIVLNALKKEEVKAVAKEEPKRNEEFDNLKVGKVVRLDNVYFDQSSYILRPESYEQLDRLSQSLKNAPALKIEIAGHTDNVGEPRLNLILSENRAKVIASYLYNKGIKDDRIIHKGYGQSQPVMVNDTEDNKRKNRRVELIVREN